MGHSCLALDFCGKSSGRVNVKRVREECLQGVKRSGGSGVDHQHRVVAEQVFRPCACEQVHAHCADHGPVYVNVYLSQVISLGQCLKSQSHFMREWLILDAGIRYGECCRYVRECPRCMVIISIDISRQVDLCVCIYMLCFRNEAGEIFCQDSLHVAAVDPYFCLYAGPAFVQPYVCISM